MNPCLQVQVKEPSLFVQSALLSHGLDSAEHSSTSVVIENIVIGFLNERCWLEDGKLVALALVIRSLVRDCFENLVLLFHPIRCKTETNGDSLVHVCCTSGLLNVCTLSFDWFTVLFVQCD